MVAPSSWWKRFNSARICTRNSDVRDRGDEMVPGNAEMTLVARNDHALLSGLSRSLRPGSGGGTDREPGGRRRDGR